MDKHFFRVDELCRYSKTLPLVEDTKCCLFLENHFMLGTPLNDYSCVLNFSAAILSLMHLNIKLMTNLVVLGDGGLDTAQFPLLYASCV